MKENEVQLNLILIVLFKLVNDGAQVRLNIFVWLWQITLDVTLIQNAPLHSMYVEQLKILMLIVENILFLAIG